MARASVAIREPLRRRLRDSTASLCSVCKTLHDDAVESTICRLNGSQIARDRTPCEQLFAWSAR
eukprot:2552421-Lingulodinium_polyedra.AAC.1